MEFDDYQNKSRATAIYPNMDTQNVVYPLLGLCGEAGELAEKIKKMLRDNNGQLNENIKASLVQELGDLLWYMAQMATELKVNLSEIAEANLKKIHSRQTRDVIHGSGDNR